ncbi:MAG: glutaminase A [Chloroflexales bacterium]
MSSEAEHDDLTAMVRSMKTMASPLRGLLADLQRTFTPLTDGQLAETPPELAKADPGWFGICVVDTHGRMYEVGDSQQLFTIQTLANPFVYGLALGEHGRDEVLARVGVAPANDSFTLSDANTLTLPNPLVVAGALGLTTLLKGSNATERLNTILALFRRLTNREVMIDATLFTSARTTGHHYRALAHFMLARGLITEDVDEALDLFFQQQSLLVTCRDLALMAATLANQGKNPVSGEAVIEPTYVRDILSVLYTCGMQNTAGTWAYRVGLPAERSVSGAIMAVVPQQLGIAVFSPLLNAQGTSVRASKVCEALSQHFNLHAFDPYERKTKLQEAIKNPSLRGGL